ncbi:DUF4866 family protein, partial [Faecalibacterium prausnitzii]|uniref:DUF4866 family protein n=1 Tax=Faecalibacterium prausnitzii TaxID=853 RepID=UPI003B97EAF8
MFKRQKNAKFIVAGSAVLERVLSIVDHATGQCVLLIYELPATVKQKETEAEAYS